ncbi:hypothetical protein QO181_33025, partial [Pseudomonas aeruginosa]|nr:hypothetical protein [Pseudomonas aeruginosa]
GRSPGQRMRCLEKKGLLTMSSQLIGVLAASTQGDADAKSLQTGAWVAGNATQSIKGTDLFSLL